MTDVLLSMPAWQALAISAVAPGVVTLSVIWIVAETVRLVRPALTERL
ncbi:MULTISPECIES: hypothetical protein [Methylorubrum]|nr:MULTISPECIES: hypothetical protein [Methylorubrum]MCP1550665.1 hypothetical protein [Methylorubrum zatmanii]MCP1552722.1 hypothetical protein [Methylorubrum extorquens]MCP1580968.1 hypothetical protein [Methylorubrum extorquens]